MLFSLNNLYYYNFYNYLKIFKKTSQKAANIHLLPFLQVLKTKQKNQDQPQFPLKKRGWNVWGYTHTENSSGHKLHRVTQLQREKENNLFLSNSFLKTFFFVDAILLFFKGLSKNPMFLNWQFYMVDMLEQKGKRCHIVSVHTKSFDSFLGH